MSARKSHGPTTRKLLRSLTKPQIGRWLLEHGTLCFEEREVAAVQRWLRGGWTCAEWDRLTPDVQYLCRVVEKNADNLVRARRAVK